MLSWGIHLLAISEAHLDDKFNDTAVGIQGYTIYWRDRNAYGGDGAVYIQNHIPVQVRFEWTECLLWLHINLQCLKPLLVRCCVRPPNIKLIYLDRLCEMLNKMCDFDNEIHFFGGLNIDWDMVNCPLEEKLQAITNKLRWWITERITFAKGFCVWFKYFFLFIIYDFIMNCSWLIDLFLCFCLKECFPSVGTLMLID